MLRFHEVYFSLWGRDFDPDEVTRIVGITPTSTQRRAHPVPKMTRWVYSDGEQDTANTDIHACSARLVAALLPGQDRIAAVRQQYALEAALVVVLHPVDVTSPPILHFPTEVIAFLGVVGASIDIDAYYWKSDRAAPDGQDADDIAGIRATTDRLFVYGTLAPGKPNAHILADVPGTWEPATVTGTLHAEGWGAAQGYPGIVLDPHGGTVHGLVFSSDELASHWARLDAFEGDGYERVVTQARLADGTIVEAFVYRLSGR